MLLMFVVVLWLVGMILLSYGVFAAPSISNPKYDFRNPGERAIWLDDDKPFLKYRAIGAGLACTAIIIIMVDSFLR